jgi:hypothetical protein
MISTRTLLAAGAAAMALALAWCGSSGSAGRFVTHHFTLDGRPPRSSQLIGGRVG